MKATLRGIRTDHEGRRVISPTPRDFEIYEAFKNRVSGAGGSTERAFVEVADRLRVSVGQVAESCYLVQQLTRTIKTAAPLPPTGEEYGGARSGEREDDTKELVLKLHHAIDMLGEGTTRRS